MAVTLILGKMLWADTERPPRFDSGVAIENGRILAAAGNAELAARFPGAERVDAFDAVITPAFVNAHNHMYGVLSHGIPLDKAPSGFWPFLEEFWWPLVENRLDQYLIEAATDWACLEMIRSGVTTFYDCLEAPNALPGALDIEARIVRRWGLRGVLSFEATERMSAENSELGLAENVNFIDSCQGRNDLVSGMGCFHTTFTCSEAFIRRACSDARTRNARIHMHLAEGTYEPEYCLKTYSKRTVEYYESLGLLDKDILASQCVQIDAHEIELLVKYGVHVSHQPISNCEVGGGFCPVPEMAAAGVKVALGTDGYVNNFFEVMRAAALIPKARLMDPTIMPAGQVWTMATKNGAGALGVKDLGTLDPGNQADLQLISAALPSPLGPHNLADQLLLWRNPADIKSVMCAGKWLMRDGKVLNVDEEAIRRRVVAAAARMWEGLGGK